MKLTDPYTGAVVDASESAAPRLLACGFKALAVESDKPKQEKQKTAQKRKR